MTRRGITLVEILVACSLLAVFLGPLGLVFSQASLETRASIDEFLASVYLAEIVDQVASMPFHVLPVAEEPVDLASEGTVVLDPARACTTVHVGAMRKNFTMRSLRIEDVAGREGRLKQIRVQVECRLSSRRTRAFEAVTCVGRPGMLIPDAGEAQ